MLDKSIGTAEKLRKYREANAMSQRQVAEALHLERSTYTKYETGDSEPNLNTLMKIARIFNVSATVLLPDDGSGDPAAGDCIDSGFVDSPVYQLSKDERALIARYRVLSKEQKKTAMGFVAELGEE